MCILNDPSITTLLRISSEGSKYFKVYTKLYNLQNVKHLSLFTELLLQKEERACEPKLHLMSGRKEIPVTWITQFETLNYSHHPENNFKIGGILVEFTAEAANCFCPKKALNSRVPTILSLSSLLWQCRTINRPAWRRDKWVQVVSSLWAVILRSVPCESS